MRRLAILLIAIILVVTASALLYMTRRHAFEAGFQASEVVTPVPEMIVLDEDPSPLPAPQTHEPGFDVVRVEPGGMAVMAGRGRPEEKYGLYLNGKLWQEVTTNAQGEWVLVPSSALQSGELTLSLIAVKDRDQDDAKTAQVVIISPGADETGQTVAVSLGSGPQSPSRILTGTPPATGSLIPSISIDTLDHDGQGHMALSGQAPAHASLELSLNNVSVARIQADEQGRWTITEGLYAAPGAHNFRLTLLSGPQNTRSAFIERNVTIATNQEPPGRLTIERGDTLWRIAHDRYGSGHLYTIIFLANKSEIKDPNLIYPGQNLTIPDSASDHPI